MSSNFSTNEHIILVIFLDKLLLSRKFIFMTTNICSCIWVPAHELLMFEVPLVRFRYLACRSWLGKQICFAGVKVMCFVPLRQLQSWYTNAYSPQDLKGNFNIGTYYFLPVEIHIFSLSNFGIQNAGYLKCKIVYKEAGNKFHIHSSKFL